MTDKEETNEEHDARVIDEASKAILENTTRLFVPTDLAGLALLKAAMTMAQWDARRHGERLTERQAFLALAEICTAAAADSEDEEKNDNS